jgi:acyl phosphate:glycerol-3-phosphate acyltransferase
MPPLSDWPPAAVYAVVYAFGYLLGSIPFGVILTRMAGTADLRTIGSGNIGATNVLRTGHKGLAAATLLGDLVKGTIAVCAVKWIADPIVPLIAGAGAFLGHLFPLWLRFKGGKGVATYIGVLLAISWPVTIAFGLIWSMTAFLTRYSSLSGLVASAATPAILWIASQGPEALLFVPLTLLLWFRHRDNIARLIRGTETRIGRKTATAPTAP